ncbi:hypothetical protein KUCAC02_010347 [Chaenocephalus aceratus]|uniref:Uncharacterized protein n=1 Tax=Chaenocephalus aceratus TaxID=36190 RepID=A0ACB9VYY2_CHAAC|nr:hypothetical protein KUCAC02_010347 [Chaenocephalus aceratus]
MCLCSLASYHRILQLTLYIFKKLSDVKLHHVGY